VWDRTCAICAKTRTEWRWPYVVGSERASWARRDVWDRGRVGSCGIVRLARVRLNWVCEDEDVWDRACGIVRTRNRE